MATGPWSDTENDLIVADYFDMLRLELIGERLNKADRNRKLQTTVSRSHGSIEFKHQNISAVLKGLGETRIQGYKPAFHYQASLEDAVLRWIAAHPEWNLDLHPSTQVGLQEGASLWIGPPPTMTNQFPPNELEQMLAIAQRFDVAGRDERNRRLGRAGEECVLQHERTALIAADRNDLAEQVRWVADLDGDGAGYDIASFTRDGKERLIEVKTTNGWERTPFYISRNEVAVAESKRDNWSLVRLWNFSREPRAFELRPPLERHVELTATSFQASFL